MKKLPAHCKNIEEIRTEIDTIDREIISLIGQRYHFVKAAAAFKKSETDVQAPDRFKSMILKRREWAEEEKLDPDMVEKLYTDMVKHFIKREMEEWKGS